MCALLLVLSSAAVGQSLPDAPQPQPKASSPKHLYSFRTRSADPPLYSNRNLLKSKLFWATHAAGFAAALVACRTRNSGENCGSELPGVGALMGMDFFAMKYMSPLYAFGAPAYEIQHYVRASIR